MLQLRGNAFFFRVLTIRLYYYVWCTNCFERALQNAAAQCGPSIYQPQKPPCFIPWPANETTGDGLQNYHGQLSTMPAYINPATLPISLPQPNAPSEVNDRGYHPLRKCALNACGGRFRYGSMPCLKTRYSTNN